MARSKSHSLRVVHARSGEDWSTWSDEELEAVEAKELTSKTRKDLDTGVFAFPRLRKLPLNDASHVRNAMARFNQTSGWTPAEKAAAKAKIIRYARKYGIEVGDFGRVSAEAIQADVTLQLDLIIEAKSLDLPKVDDHPNRMPFRGILTKVGLPSDKAPNGAHGKRVMLTHEAAEAALDSLLGMGVDLAKDMRGHDVKSKVGIITSANVEGNDLNIEGFIYCADFPEEALRIHMQQAQLGFSFEAQQLAVESLDADPLVVKSCVFTGAAILMKNDAAYQTTALAASRAKEKETMEIQEAVKAALDAALGPMTAQITALSAQNDALVAKVDELKKAPPQIMANSIMCAKMEPHAGSLEAAADKMEQEQVGLHPTRGHVSALRRMAAGIRSDAANGKVPHEWHESGSYWASGEPPAPQPKIEEAPQFKALQASVEKLQADHAAELEKAAKEHTDKVSSLETMMKDMKAAMDKLQPAPERKTIGPAATALLERFALEAPENGGKIPMGKIDAALAVSVPDIKQRIMFKNQLDAAGVI